MGEGREVKQKTILGGGWLWVSLCSLRRHNPDQVMRVERGSLLSAPPRGLPVRLIVTQLIYSKLRACQPFEQSVPGWTFIPARRRTERMSKGYVSRTIPSPNGKTTMSDSLSRLESRKAPNLVTRPVNLATRPSSKSKILAKIITT